MAAYGMMLGIELIPPLWYLLCLLSGGQERADPPPLVTLGGAIDGNNKAP